MTRVSEQARITVDGKLRHVAHDSPLEDQVQVVYEAAHRYALANRFGTHVHQGPNGPRKGLAGPMVMKRLIGQLFPEMENDDVRHGLISQVLKRTDAAVCLKRPKPRNNDPGNMPVWFVADEMPKNIVVVAIFIAQRSAGFTGPVPPNFDEDSFLTKREKYKVTPDEAGETLEPGHVTVKRNDTPESTAGDRFESHREWVRKEHARLKERVFDELQTTPIALAADELAVIVNRDPENDWHISTYRECLKELVEEGRVVTRREVDSERLLRGGGKMPKASRKTLYAPAPEPVPIRESLPGGIQPLRPAIEWSTEQKAQFAADTQLILTTLETRGGREKNPPRSLNQLTEASGLSADRVRQVLEKLVRDGVVYERNSYFYLESRRRSWTAETATPSTEEPEVFTAEPTPNIVQPSPPSVVPDPDDLAIVMRVAESLGVTLPQGDEKRVEFLEEQLDSSTRAVTALQTENDKLRKQVAALRAAIATME